MNRIFCFFASIGTALLLAGNIALADAANTAFNQGFARHQRGDLPNAVLKYSSAIEENPAFAMAYQMRGIARQQLKNYPEAISDYSMVITTGDNSFKVVGFYNRGVVKNMIGNFSGAIDDFSQTIALDKKMAAAFFHRGIAKSKIGDLNGRLEDFRQAATLGELNAERWLNTYYPAWKQMPPAQPPLPIAPAVPPASREETVK